MFVFNVTAVKLAISVGTDFIYMYMFKNYVMNHVVARTEKTKKIASQDPSISVYQSIEGPRLTQISET